MEGLARPSWNPQRRCTGTNRTGERCWRQPIPGGTVCVMHGGASPQVQKSARERLLAGADLAIDALLRVLESHGPPCEHCGRSDGDRDPAVVSAARVILDRSGFHPSVTIQQQAPIENPFVDMTPEQFEAAAERLLESARDLRRAEAFERAPCGPNSVDGGLLPEATDGVLIVDDVHELEPEPESAIPQGELHPEEVDADK
ncbi:MAG: hypothetical protein WBC33_01240 [Conexibacter sp.]